MHQLHQLLSTVAAAESPAVAAGARVLAAKGEAGVTDWNWLTFLSTIVAFLLCLAITAKVIWPKVLGGLEAREEKIRSEIKAAEEARKRADEALKDYESSLQQARAEAAEMIEKTKAEQSRMAADLRTKAEAELTEMRESARRGIEAAKRAALAEIYQESAVLATQIAEKILEREVNEQDQSRLVEETLAEITKDRPVEPQPTG
jgi:F-type H+-transporting ATPase subunit b